MAGGAFLSLLDDVVAAAKVAAASADDVAVLTMQSGQKASGIVVDDMAVTAGSMVGIDPSRELPIVWAVAKGSLINKFLYLIPAALALNYIAPQVIPPILMLGGAYLCMEAVEKILHHKKEDQEPHFMPATLDPVQLEKDKIKGAIRTDMILSAEIVALTLAGVADKSTMVQMGVLYGVGLAMTVGVYGIVGLLVKLDDIGLHLVKQPAGFKHRLGSGILKAAPYLFQVIAFIGTAAMLLVGGGIIVHGLHIDALLSPWTASLTQDSALFKMALNTALSTVIGVIAGFITLCGLFVAMRIWPLLKRPS